MQGKEASFRTGCWRRTLLSCVLALSLIPLAVHGNAVGTNATEPDSAANVTSLLSEEDGPVKVNEAVLAVTGTTSLASPDTVTPRAGRIPRAGEEDEQSSGMFPETLVPALEEVAAPPQISPDSAETEHLLPSNPRGQDVVESEEEEEEDEARLPNTDPPWIHAKDTAVFDLDHLFTTTTAQPSAPNNPTNPTNPSNPDVLHVDFFDPSSRGRGLDLAPPSPSSLAHELQGGDATSWAMPDNYDYLTPYEDGVSPTADEYTYSTTTDTYESDEDLRLAGGSPARSKPRVPASGPFIPGAPRPGGRAPVPNVPGVAPPMASPVDGSDGMGGCRVGYQMVNGSCRSPCDMLPNYCFNGGQCYLLEGMGVFCRCNVQDYIWHKGARCESVVTEFQVMCLAVGASALVVLLLFMIIVCFAKKLHVLKTENKKLRKRSKYRPSSEQHNDNFSLSTIAEGSHPNVRKLCDTPPNVPHARALAYYDNIICQKTMSRYTWECKTKEESDCEVRPNPEMSESPAPVSHPPKQLSHGYCGPVNHPLNSQWINLSLIPCHQKGKNQKYIVSQEDMTRDRSTHIMLPVRSEDFTH
ncbi:chondroitin sulfate proteoglycan 5 isoform X2 [Etheostoma cragini]|uniref:chondroitin sulfate proteoglycan 5 isoform X2 n=1 Tax=Etheostoma cragini TaxID=417921 RepID=UPI00155E9C5B|nr:chondroitin sulfate proteoglycan 5 isoform X2 [Etheostoma cragini]